MVKLMIFFFLSTNLIFMIKVIIFFIIFCIARGNKLSLSNYNNQMHLINRLEKEQGEVKLV